VTAALELRWQKLDIQRATLYAIDEHNRLITPHNGIVAHPKMQSYFLNRLTVNYLRHCWTNYEWAVGGLTLNCREYQEIWVELCLEMSQQYPSLREEIKQQAIRRGISYPSEN
jgi:hypothetical protein